MEIEISMEDIHEIEDKMEDLTGWLVSNFTSPVACLIVLQGVQDKVKEFKKIIDFDGEEDE